MLTNPPLPVQCVPDSHSTRLKWLPLITHLNQLPICGHLRPTAPPVWCQIIVAVFLRLPVPNVEYVNFLYADNVSYLHCTCITDRNKYSLYKCDSYEYCQWLPVLDTAMHFWSQETKNFLSNYDIIKMQLQFLVIYRQIHMKVASDEFEASVSCYYGDM